MTEVEGQFIVPVFDGKRGHPVLLSNALIKKLRLEPVESNLKEFRDRQKVTYREVNR
jgi:molybdenum cofactor cytidylyltransferase